MHSSLRSEEMFAQTLSTPRQERLDQSTESPKFLISSGSAPTQPLQSQGDFSQTSPESAVFSGISSAEAEEKKQGGQ